MMAKVINDARHTFRTTKSNGIALHKSGADVSRSVLFYRLNYFRAEGVVHGKQIGSGKGNWVWVVRGVDQRMTEVKSATDAMRIGREAASEAGQFFAFVSGARKEGNEWIVNVISIAGLYEARIAVTSGEVTEWKMIQAPQKS